MSIGKAIALPILLLLGIFVYQPWRTCACGPPTLSGARAVRFFFWYQEDYHAENQIFAESLEQLPTYATLEHFNVTLQGTADKTTIRATPKNATVPIDAFKLGLRKYSFRSIVGTVIFEDGEFQNILCESQDPTTTVSPDTSLKNGKLFCPASFNEIHYGK